jgi:putative SOS response-associated peptidase YedK
MCGRYVLYGPHSRLTERFSLQECPDIAPRYNIAPTSDVLVIRQRPEVGRVGQMVRWGLVPNWAKDITIGAKLNNARAETVDTKPSFRTSFAKHRCLIPANGFYEWKVVSEGGRCASSHISSVLPKRMACSPLSGYWRGGVRRTAATW